MRAKNLAGIKRPIDIAVRESGGAQAKPPFAPS